MRTRASERLPEWRGTTRVDLGSRRRNSALLVVAACALLALIAGLVVPISDGTRPAPAVLRTLAGTDVSLSVPADWQPVARPAPLPGLASAQTVAWASGADTLAASRASALGPGYLPAALAEDPATRVTGADAISLGVANAFRFHVSRAGGVSGDVYIVPDGTRALVLDCRSGRGGSGGFRSACASVLSTLSSPTLAPVELAPDRAYNSALQAAIGTLTARRAHLRSALGSAGGPSGQVAATLALTQAYRSAATRLQTATVLLATARAGRSSWLSTSALALALARVAGAYRRMASAAAHSVGSAFRAASGAVVAGEAAAERELAVLAAIGYRP